MKFSKIAAALPHKVCRLSLLTRLIRLLDELFMDQVLQAGLDLQQCCQRRRDNRWILQDERQASPFFGHCPVQIAAAPRHRLQVHPLVVAQDRIHQAWRESG